MNTRTLDDSIKEYFRILLASNKEKNVKQKNRYDAVLLYMEGYSRKQISEILHIPHRTVNSHIAKYESGGMEAPLLIKQPGAPRKLSGGQEKELLSVISTMPPEEAGAGVFANWTAALACAYVKDHFGVSFSNRGMLNLFGRLGLIFLPPYSPNLNKLGELWGWLKDSVINNVFFHTREKIQQLYKNLSTG